MLKSYIPTSLIRELREVFPNRLPSQGDYYRDEQKITSEQIAFNAGIQHCIDYLEQLSNEQNDLN